MSLDRSSTAQAVVSLQTRVYPCSHCTRGFLSKRECLLHEIFHLKATRKNQTTPIPEKSNKNDKYSEKPFKCENCSASFVLCSTLEAHSVIHKPYTYICHCGIGYYSKKDFQGHKFLIHSGATDKHEPKVEIVEDEEIADDELFQELTKKIAESENKPEEDYETFLDVLSDNSSDEDFKIKSRHKKPVSKRGAGQQKNKVKKKKKKRSVHKTKNIYDSEDAIDQNPRTIRKTKEHNENDVVVVQGPEGFECPRCYLSIKEYRNLVSHYAEHVDKMPYVCEHCAKSFLLQSYYKRHIQYHSKDFTCRFCAKKFAFKRNLQVHLYTHTGEKPHKCEECGKCFSQKGTLQMHQDRHRNEKNHVCKVCQKAFNNKNNLQVHERIHANLRPFKCSFCSKGFNDPSAHKRHERIHTGRVMYTCQYCKKTFTDYSAYVVHKRRHENDRKYPCNACEKTFYTKSDMLKHHHAIHDNIKPFECDICSKTFSTKSNMKLHLLAIHALKKLKRCKICKNKYYDIQRHIKFCGTRKRIPIQKAEE